MLDICLLGCGGMMPLPYRYLTSLLARFEGSSLLIDCGEGTQIALRKAGWSFKPIDVICFTHYHGDHIAGLPGLLLTMGNSDRTEPLMMIGPKGLERTVNALRTITPDLPFPIVFRELQEAEESFNMNGYRMRAFRVKHSVTCYGYSLEIDRAGRFDPERAKAAGIPLAYWKRLQKGEIIQDGEQIFTPDQVLGPERKGLKVTYTTDTRPTESIVKNAENADLLICEGMYGEQELLGKAIDKKHMTFLEAAKIAKEAGVKKLWLTHYSPSLIKPEPYMDAVREIFPDAEPGKDGKMLELRFEEE